MLLHKKDMFRTVGKPVLTWEVCQGGMQIGMSQASSSEMGTDTAREKPIASEDPERHGTEVLEPHLIFIPSMSPAISDSTKPESSNQESPAPQILKPRDLQTRDRYY